MNPNIINLVYVGHRYAQSNLRISHLRYSITVSWGKRSEPQHGAFQLSQIKGQIKKHKTSLLEIYF